MLAGGVVSAGGRIPSASFAATATPTNSTSLGGHATGAGSKQETRSHSHVGLSDMAASRSPMYAPSRPSPWGSQVGAAVGGMGGDGRSNAQFKSKGKGSGMEEGGDRISPGLGLLIAGSGDQDLDDSANAIADLIDSVSVRVIGTVTIGSGGTATPAVVSPFSLFGSGVATHTAYRVQVAAGPREWEVKRRYSSFRQLLVAVTESMGQGTVERLLPGFPIRTVLSSAMDPRVVSER